MKDGDLRRGLALCLPFLAAMGAALVLLGEGTADPAREPCVVMTHEGGSRVGAKSGLVLAVWEDGAMLFAASSAEPGERLLVGRAERADVAAMLEAISKAGFIEEKREHHAVPDSASTTIMARTGGKKSLHTWHGCLLPGFGGDINTDGDYRRFVRMWKGTLGAIEGLPPVEVHRLEEKAPEGKFRGLDPKEPWKTAWMRPEAWRR